MGARAVFKTLLALLLSLTGAFWASASAATSLEELLSKIDTLSPHQIREEIRKLPQEEKLRLELLLLSYGGENPKVKEIVKKVYSGKLMTNVLELPDDLYAIVVDKTNEILYVVKMEKGAPKVVKKLTCITGKRPGDKLEEGDMRTPEGIYFPLYWNSKVPARYGIGAFPLNYPNLIDRKILHRNGHGIWIHGTDDPNRPSHSTNGCVAMKNDYLKELKKYIKPKRTPVIIVSELSLEPKEKYLSEKESLLSFILRWKKAWEETPKNIQPYLDCYSKDFVWAKGDYEDWVRYKKRVTRGKRWIKIKLSDITAAKDGRILKFGNLYVVRMELDYRSNNFKSKSNKVLYIIREKGGWKIIGEENL